MNAHIRELVTQANELLAKQIDLIAPSVPVEEVEKVTQELNTVLDQLDQYGTVSYRADEHNGTFVLVGSGV